MNDIYRGEIYHIHETEVHGSEQSGGRPGIIISNDIGNKYAPVVIVVYLTTQEKKPLPTHVKINTICKPSIALCEQIETVCKARIGKYIGQITEEEQKHLDQALGVSIGIGLNIKSNKVVQSWAKNYEKASSRTMKMAIEKAGILKLSKQEENGEQTKEEMGDKNAWYKNLIQLETEKNIYQKLYFNLLEQQLQMR